MHFLKGNCIKGDQCSYLHERNKNDLEIEFEQNPQKPPATQRIFKDNQKLQGPPYTNNKREFLEKTQKPKSFKGQMHSDFGLEEEEENESIYPKNNISKMQNSPPQLSKYTKPPFKMNIQKRGRSNEEEEELNEERFPNRNSRKQINYQNEEEMERKPRIASNNNINFRARQKNSNAEFDDESHSPSLPVLKKKFITKKMEAESEIRKREETSPFEPKPKSSITNNNKKK